MFYLTVGLLLIFGAIGAWAMRRSLADDPAQRVLISVGALVAIAVGLGVIVWSTAIYVEDDQGGVVVVKFGADLPADKIIAVNGEKGPQAEVLPPGWHFFYWPWLYELELVDNIDIPEGRIGVVTARDGLPLPAGEVYAPAWPAPDLINDGLGFLTGNGGYRGYSGPQLTVLPPRQYRYNPRLFQVELKSLLEVPVGEVAVIKANAGLRYEAAPGEVELVNGTPIVPRGYRGIWSTVLTPEAYYLHPGAFVVTTVQTTNRVYDYADKSAIAVRTKDGFEFPVDVRVSVKVSAENAPYVVAKLANPDARHGQFTVLEELVVLPLVRAIFRNTAESRNALEFVNQRSVIEQLATDKLREGMREYRIETDGVYIADIRIGDTDAGRALLATQTDREVAVQQQETFRERQRAQIARSEAVRSEEEANQQVEQARARSRVIVADEDAKAEVARATGEAQAYLKKMEALGGVDNFIRLELMRLAMEKWEGSVPRVFTTGGSAGGNDPMQALTGLMLDRLDQQEKTPAAR